MKRFDILLTDPVFSTKAEFLLGEMIHFSKLDFNAEIRKELGEASSSLAKEMTTHVSKGELIPSYLLEQFLMNILVPQQDQDILLIRFPNSMEQFRILERVLGKLNRKLHTIWYFRHTDPEAFWKKEKKTNVWFQKFDDELQVQRTRLENRRKLITGFQQASGEINWQVLEVADEQELTAKIQAYV